jgi:hypothetical protein
MNHFMPTNPPRAKLSEDTGTGGQRPAWTSAAQGFLDGPARLILGCSFPAARPHEGAARTPARRWRAARKQ